MLTEIFQIIVILVVLGLAGRPIGKYLANIYGGEGHPCPSV